MCKSQVEVKSVTELLKPGNKLKQNKSNQPRSQNNLQSLQARGQNAAINLKVTTGQTVLRLIVLKAVNETDELKNNTENCDLKNPALAGFLCSNKSISFVVKCDRF